MDIETKFNVGDVVCLDLGLVRAGGTRGIVMTVNVAIDALRQYITYTVTYEGKTITVPESMLSHMTCTVHEEAEKEQGKQKELTADKLYELISKSHRIYWNDDFYEVFHSNEEGFCLHDGDFGEEYKYTYEEFIEELKKSNFDITFYTLETLKY